MNIKTIAEFFLSILCPGFLFNLQTREIDSKILLNFTLTHHIHTNIDLFVNTRNVLGNNSQEFGFTDNTNRLCLSGLRFEY
ncbi:hypothetical protein JW835_02545 [bacterium]|nr:hypothetical protein [bacterium]